MSIEPPGAPPRVALLPSWRSRTVLDLVAGTVAGTLATLPLGAVFGGFLWAVALVSGIVTAFVAVRAGRALGWWPPVTAVVVLAVLTVLSVLAVGATLPYGGRGTALRLALVDSPAAWRTLLTAAPPVGGRDGLLVVPLQLGTLAGVLLGGLGLLRRPLVLLVPLLLGVAALLLGLDRPVLAVVTACGAGVVVALWAARRYDLTAVRPPTGSPLRRWGARVGLVLVGALVVTAPAAAGAVPVPGDRFVLRDLVEPEVDVAAYQSPLSGLRQWTKQGQEDELFTVSLAGPLPAPPSTLPVAGTDGSDATGGTSGGAGTDGRLLLRLAGLDSYDGVTWRVGPATGPAESSDRFERIAGGSLAWSTAPLPDTGPRVAATLTVTGLRGRWVPLPGTPLSVALDGPDAGQRSAGLLYDDASDTVVLESGLRSGDVIESAALVPAVPAAAADAPAADLLMPPLQLVPDRVAATAAVVAGDAGTPFETAAALADTLRTTGYYSDGSAGTADSPAGHGVDRIQAFLDSEVLVGDAEQYAAAMALMARHLGLPARVAVGFVAQADPGADPGTPVTVTGAQATAWVEVAFEGVGWVPFFPTPDRDRVPPEQQTRPREQQQNVVPPPPPPPDLRPPDPVEDRPEDQEEDEEEPPDLTVAPVAAVVAGGGGLLLVLLAVGGVLAAKALRRRRRRTRGPLPARAAGAWEDLIDRHVDLGWRPPAAATRTEEAAALGEDPGALMLARQVDDAVFAASAPPAPVVDRLWHEARQIARRRGRTVPWPQRLRGSVSLRSLRARGGPAVRVRPGRARREVRPPGAHTPGGTR